MNPLKGDKAKPERLPGTQRCFNEHSTNQTIVSSPAVAWHASTSLHTEAQLPAGTGDGRRGVERSGAEGP